MDLKFVIYSITKHVRTCICYCKKNNRLTPMPIATHMHGYIGWRGFKYWAWILLICSISLYLGTCSHIHLVGFSHDALRRSSITCSYFIWSSAWVVTKISGAAAKYTHITWQYETHPHHVTVWNTSTSRDSMKHTDITWQYESDNHIMIAYIYLVLYS